MNSLLSNNWDNTTRLFLNNSVPYTYFVTGMFEDIGEKVIKEKIDLPGLTSANREDVQSDELYHMLKGLEEIAYPSLESDYVRAYSHFFFPVKGMVYTSHASLPKGEWDI